MFGTTNYPFNFANRNGIPLIESNSIEVTTDSVVIKIPNKAFRWLNLKGIILFKLGLVIPTGTTETLPIVFSSNDYTLPLTNIGGTPITVASINTGVYLIYYDKDASLMQLLTSEIIN